MNQLQNRSRHHSRSRIHTLFRDELLKSTMSFQLKILFAFLMCYNAKCSVARTLENEDKRMQLLRAGMVHLIRVICAPTRLIRVAKYHLADGALHTDYLFRLAVWVLFEFLGLHPFSDGNGRVTRMLYRYILMKLAPFPTPICNIYSETIYSDYVDDQVRIREKRQIRMPVTTDHPI